MEGLVVSELASDPRVDEGYSVMPLVTAWGSKPGGRYWEPGCSKSSFKASLGRGMVRIL